MEDGNVFYSTCFLTNFNDAISCGPLYPPHCKAEMYMMLIILSNCLSNRYNM